MPANEVDPRLAERIKARKELLENSERFIADVGQMKVQKTPGKDR